MSGNRTARKRSSSSNNRSSNSSTNNKSSVLFAVGNTYERLPEQTTQWNRKGDLKKIHDWILYVDILQGDVNLIQAVEFHLGGSFQPSTFVCSSPTRQALLDGSVVARFKTRQQSTGAIVATIKLVGRGGGGGGTSSSTQIRHAISLQAGGRREMPQRFNVSSSSSSRIDTSSRIRPQNRMTTAHKQTRSNNTKLQMAPFPSNRTFGIELELSCAQGSSHEQIAQSIQSRVPGVSVVVVRSYGQAHTPVSGWKLVHDGSIQCDRNAPNCSKFELVSPILKGSKGLETCDKVLKALQAASSSTMISVNKSMGFHVHISVEGMPVSDLKKVCQNFVKYEDAMDSFMPRSRRTGSTESNQYFRSCKAAIQNPATNNGDRHRAIEACRTTEVLCHLMNPRGRYYKLNMQNLVTRRQPTVEFRQHSATAIPSKVTAWVRFCMAMVHNSARLAPPSFCKNSRTAEEQFDLLFQHVIKDRALRDVFVARRAQVQATPALRGDRGPAGGAAAHRSGRACCEGCAHGHGCARGNRR